MQVTLGFFVLLVLIILPGLIYRRLYYYGEFSKQFSSNQSLIKTFFLSAIPGFIILSIIYLFYDNYITEIDIGKIIDKFKEINDPVFSFRKSSETPLRDLVNHKVAPFISFLYLTSIILGAISGRFIRISKLDTKFKLLRFKNYWFYLFNGQHTDFKKMKHLRKLNKKHLFTKADILIDFNSKSELYSGIIVDYELDNDNCNVLNKIMLQEAQRYKFENHKKQAIPIPGSLFIVDCSSIKNINLTHIYEDSKSILNSKLPNVVEMFFGLILIILIPFFIFKSDSINFSLYNEYFELHWYEKIVAYFLVSQILSIINPFVKKGDEYEFINFKNIFVKIMWLIFLSFLLWIL